jgi:oligopeptidase A
VLSADPWGAFEEEGVFNAGTAARFLHKVLEVGGSRGAMDHFKAFAAASPASMRCCDIRAWPDTHATAPRDT